MKIKRFTFDKLFRKIRVALFKEEVITGDKRQKIIDDFNVLFYNEGGPDCKWFGFDMIKYPTDLMIYQEIIYETKPDIIIETGTHKGGSALYFANLFDIRGYGEVISIDINKREDFPKHKRITYLTGRSDKKEILDKLKFICAEGRKVMVILDSDHDYKTVLDELKNYSKFVSKDCYLIVEDSNINGHPVHKQFGKGPYEAIEEFMKDNKDFKIEKSRERFLLTANPNGFMRRIK